MPRRNPGARTTTTCIRPKSSLSSPAGAACKNEQQAKRANEKPRGQAEGHQHAGGKGHRSRPDTVTPTEHILHLPAFCFILCRSRKKRSVPVIQLQNPKRFDIISASSFRIWNSSTGILSLPGASVRSSTHDKGHEEGGSAYAKAGSSFRSPPGNSRAYTPQTRVCLLSACAFT